ncbi:hypothetical protein BDFG_06128 [Blastomyces dermatitidis ATCC 26199]|nr:hypothetical protein BDFG_06128 [Blastomyces dermatitidis ATCC 26199]
MFLAMTSHSHNKCHCSAHTEQFISKYIIMNDTLSSSSYMSLIISFSVKSSHVDRSASVNDSKLNVELLIENLENAIMKKLSVLYVTESSMSLPALSAAAS